MIMRGLIFACAFVLFVGPAHAQEARLRVDGNALIYDTSVLSHAGEEREEGIEAGDIDPFLDLLRAHDGVEVVMLHSGGGYVWPAKRLSEIIIDFELSTHVSDICESTCTDMFIAGERRTMQRGAKLGFHQSWWDAASIQDYYQENAGGEGWETPWDFASWLYEDTQSDVFKRLSYLVDRGVSAEFAIKTIEMPSELMWYPTRKELRAANVLTE